ncbi:hypothetical protein CR513_58504, partial [Mucuna pruriens]
MSKSSSQNSSRCKDFNVKHALQICVVLGVCIWLIYLVQHFHEKRTSYGEDTKTDNEFVKLGRKDHHPYVEQSSIMDVGHEEEEDEKENKYKEQKKTNNVNGMEYEILTHKNEQNNNEEKFEHSWDQVNKDTEENMVTNKESGKNEYKNNKEGEDNKSKLEDNQSKKSGEEKSKTGKEETIEVNEIKNEEDEEIDQNNTEAKEVIKGNHKKEDTKESSATENEREENNEIQESPKDGVKDQDGKGNNDEAREEHYASNVVGLDKSEQTDKREKNEFELESQSQTNDIGVAHLQQDERVLNVTQPKPTQDIDFVVTITNQGNGSENWVDKNNDSQKSFINESNEHNKPSSDDVETLHSHNETDTTSNTTEFFFETLEHSKVANFTFHNTTLKVKGCNLDDATEQDDSTLTNSSKTCKSNKENVNDNDHGGSVNDYDSSILEEKNASLNNIDNVGQVENENIDTRKNEDEAKSELVELQKEKEESTHQSEMVITTLN